MTKLCLLLVTAALLGALVPSTEGKNVPHTPAHHRLTAVGSVVHTPRELIPIDGEVTTIAIATARQMSGTQIALSFADLVISILKALNQPEFDYWGEVKEEVMKLVGEYINEHNMNQVEAFQKDLETLLVRYLEAPMVSDNYADKNKQAAALSVAIIGNRYLVTSGLLRHSLILHFEDIASMHLVVLKDAAETYSTDSSPSQWWVDLNRALEGYIAYSVTVTQELQVWRMDMITCNEDIDTCSGGTCYDIYTVTDGVTGEQSPCKQLHGATGCVNHCELYRAHRQQELDVFITAKVLSVRNVWIELKKLSSQKTRRASKYYDPTRHM